jgi:farnesyl diphosphate synthase
MSELQLAKSLEETGEIIQNRIDRLLKINEKTYAPKLVEAIRYSSLIKGKNIRPFLTITISEIFGTKNQYVIDVAVAIEIIHIYSLIHDDLPAMDDDDYRRKQLSCHKKYDEATAILAGDSLLTFAFEILSNIEDYSNSYNKLKLINMIAKNIGFQGMAGGQMLDLEAKNRSKSKNISKIHLLKTGKLFAAAIEAAIILSNISSNNKEYLLSYGHELGLLFQIKDDILDHHCDDQQNLDPVSIVDNIGLANAEKQMELIYNKTLSHLDQFGNEVFLLRELPKFIINQN